jgi:hypothetical protein
VVDTDWVSVSEAAARVGMSRQGAFRAASGPLCKLVLSRQDAAGSWEIADLAVEYYIEHRQWPKSLPAQSGPGEQRASTVEGDDNLLRTIDELRNRVESAEMGAALEGAAANAAQLVERDVRIEALQQTIAELRAELDSVRAEYSSVLLARAASMTTRSS